ncbi:MAG: helix-turn-helix transcriptional regulator [Sarcina sp.]
MFKENLKMLREIHCLTQGDLAKRLKVSRTTVSHWETGLSEPSLSLLIDIANCFNTSVDTILGRTLLNSENKDELSIYIEDCIRLYFKHLKK